MLRLQHRQPYLEPFNPFEQIKLRPDELTERTSAVATHTSRLPNLTVFSFHIQHGGNSKTGRDGMLPSVKYLVYAALIIVSNQLLQPPSSPRKIHQSK